MKKWQIGMLMIVAVFVALGATKVNTAVLPDDDGPKNLKVLPKDINEKELHRIMRVYSVSLGVHCGFCHAKSSADSTKLDFASDAKDEKKAARHMMQMTASINSTYFNWNNSTKPDTIHAVVCYTCHRGHSQPDGKVLSAQVDSIMATMMKKR